DNSVGGSTAAARNVISGNNWSGVALFHTGTTGNAVQGNFIGTTPTGNAPLGNGAGVWLAEGASSNVIGGTIAGERNVIAANLQQGAMPRHAGPNGTMVRGNYIGTTAAGNAPLGNAQGVRIALGASFNTIGGTAFVAGAANVISGNQGEGVALTDAGTTSNV